MLIIGLIISLSVNIHSDNGSFRAVIQYCGGAEYITESFVLHDRFGDALYTKRNVELHTFFICNTGGVFALNEKLLCFYYPDGREISLKELLYPNGFGFSPDNSLFFASDRDGLYAYSQDGILVSVYRPGRLFASTERGDYVAVISADTLFVYDNGTLRDTEFLPSPYAHDLLFSADEKNILVRFPGTDCIYDTGTRTWVEQQ
jgi:hypothetical protein